MEKNTAENKARSTVGNTIVEALKKEGICFMWTSEKQSLEFVAKCLEGVDYESK